MTSCTLKHDSIHSHSEGLLIVHWVKLRAYSMLNVLSQLTTLGRGNYQAMTVNISVQFKVMKEWRWMTSRDVFFPNVTYARATMTWLSWYWKSCENDHRSMLQQHIRFVYTRTSAAMLDLEPWINLQVLKQHQNIRMMLRSPSRRGCIHLDMQTHYCSAYDLQKMVHW